MGDLEILVMDTLCIIGACVETNVDAFGFVVDLGQDPAKPGRRTVVSRKFFVMQGRASFVPKLLELAAGYQYGIGSISRITRKSQHGDLGRDQGTVFQIFNFDETLMYTTKRCSCLSSTTPTHVFSSRRCCLQRDPTLSET